MNFIPVFRHCYQKLGTSPVAQMVKYLPTMRETGVQSPGRADLLEKEMATHSSIPAWEIPRSEELDELQSMGSQRIGRKWASHIAHIMCMCVYTCVHYILKEKKIFWCSNSLKSDSLLFIYYPQGMNSGLPRKVNMKKNVHNQNTKQATIFE